MKFLLAALAGLFVTNTVATEGLKLDLSGCRVDGQSFGCPCTGGSGNYAWKFTHLPEGWEARNDRIYPKSGHKWDNKRVYGGKLQIHDKRTKQQLKRSLFWSFDNGKVQEVTDDDFDFDADKWFSDQRQNRRHQRQQGKGIDLPNILTQQNSSGRFSKLRNIFNRVDGIGGGLGLNRLSSFFLGKGNWKDDDGHGNRQRRRHQIEQGPDGQYFDDDDLWGQHTQSIFGKGFRGKRKNATQIRGGNTQNKKRRVRVNRCNVFSPSWTQIYGQPYLGATNASQHREDNEQRKKWEKNDFKCGENNKGVKSYRGKIISIQGNRIRVANRKNQQCDVFLGGCTSIQATNKIVPNVGDHIFWRGSRRPTRQRVGQGNQFNAHHIACF